MVSIAHFDLFVLWLFSLIVIFILVLVAGREYKAGKILDLAISSILIAWATIHCIHTLVILINR